MGMETFVLPVAGVLGGGADGELTRAVHGEKAQVLSGHIWQKAAMSAAVAAAPPAGQAGWVPPPPHWTLYTYTCQMFLLGGGGRKEGARP